MSDLIYRQDALDAIQKRADEIDSVYSAFWEGLKIARDIVEKVPSAEPGRKWIPVTEALPEEEKNVLVTVHFDGFKNAYINIPPSDYVDIASQYEGYWSSPSDEYKVAESRHHVIAWKPLPEPWRGER